MDKVYYHHYTDPYDEFVLFVKDVDHDVPIISFKKKDLQEMQKNGIRVYNSNFWIRHFHFSSKSTMIQIFVSPDEIEIKLDSEGLCDVTINRKYKSICSEYTSKQKSINRIKQALVDVIKSHEELKENQEKINKQLEDVLKSQEEFKKSQDKINIQLEILYNKTNE